MNTSSYPCKRLILICLSALLIASSRAQTADWSAYLGTAAHSSYNDGSTAITPTSAPNLIPKWTFIDPVPTLPGQPNAGFNASPTVVNGRVYLGSNTGMFYALDSGNGSLLWQKLLGYTTPLSCRYGHGVTSTAAVATDPVDGALVIYVGGGDGYLYALDADTGDTIWRTIVVDIGTTENSGYLWGSPLVINNRVSIGISSACDLPLIRGGLKSFDMHSGTLVRTYWTTPKGTPGASIWTSAASDGRSFWATIGNGDAGDSFALVQLNANLRFKSKYTVPNTAGTDLDWGSSPTLFEAPLNGRRTRMVGANQKNGTFYAFKAADLGSGPVWSRMVGVEGDLGTVGTCLAAPIWNATSKQLFVGSNQTVIGSAIFAGSIRSLDPANGAVVWETGLTAGPVVGSPSLNGGGVLAAATYNLQNPTGNKVYLLDSSNGRVVTSLDAASPIFSQPVFADQLLLVATSGGLLTAYGF
ncbi:MAG: PQQ-binding-like beta-propeller repeat protein [Chthoniobacterales bacterium]